MTLNTAIYLRGLIQPEQAFDLGLRALMDAAGRGSEDLSLVVRNDRVRGEFPDWLSEERLADMDEETRALVANSTSALATRIWQGLPGIVEVKYDPSGPLAPEAAPETDEDMGHPAHDLELSWDTGYAYSVGGMGCADLHGQALINLAALLPEGVTLSWRNEYTGEVYEGVTEEALREFTRNGLNASEWFTTQVLPAMRSGALIEAVTRGEG